MSEIYERDESIHEPTTAHMHPLETTPQGSQADGVEGQHEHRDVSFQALGKWFLGLFVGIIVSFWLMVLFFHWAVSRSMSDDSQPSAMFAQREFLQRSWPDPRGESPLQKPHEVPILLPEPEEPNKNLRVYEDETLSTYNWAKDERGRKTGGVTLPIDRAMDLTLQRGLPADNKTELRPDPAQAEVVRPGNVR